MLPLAASTSQSINGTDMDGDHGDVKVQTRSDGNATAFPTTDLNNSTNQTLSGFNISNTDASTSNSSKYVAVKKILPTNLNDANCFSFNCTTNITKCDNFLPTDYNGTEPPCCVHVLRDMSRVFDESMEKLGLDYLAQFGTLLGLKRSDKLIAWTADNDYIIPSKDVMTTMFEQWDTKMTGLAHIFQGINRICVTPDFAQGKLQQWTLPPLLPSKQNSAQLWEQGYPYIDLYVGHNISQTMYSEFPGCSHFYSDIFPTKRVLVYNNTFAQNFPANSEQLLRTSYGNDWRQPDPKHALHGSGICPHGAYISGPLNPSTPQQALGSGVSPKGNLKGEITSLKSEALRRPPNPSNSQQASRVGKVTSWKKSKASSPRYD